MVVTAQQGNMKSEARLSVKIAPEGDVAPNWTNKAAKVWSPQHSGRR